MTVQSERRESVVHGPPRRATGGSGAHELLALHLAFHSNIVAQVCEMSFLRDPRLLAARHLANCTTTFLGTTVGISPLKH